jgi:hypothetical protein
MSFRYAMAAVVVVGALAFTLLAMPELASPSRASAWWTNCTQLHKRYKHGLGRRFAHDHTKSGTNPVTTFYRSTRLYNIAISHNKRLDADKDGVACEAH